jgi:hypothetical protein
MKKYWIYLFILNMIISAYVWPKIIQYWAEILFHESIIISWWQGILIGFIPIIGWASIPLFIFTMFHFYIIQ